MTPNRVLYVAPRYHTNQVPIMKGWHDMGVSVCFFVAYQGSVESHDYARLYQMKPSLSTRLYWKYVDAHYDAVKAQYTKGKSFMPSFGDVYRQIKSFFPDVVVLRNYSAGNALIVFVCHLLGIKRIAMYVQEPLYGEPQRGSFLKRVFKSVFFPHVVFTPVLYNGKERTKERLSGKADAFIPLICDMPSTTYRGYCPQGIIRLLYVGKYRPYKNHYYVVDSIEKAAKQGGFQLTFIGQLSNDVEKNYYQDLKAYVVEKGLQDRIRLRGDVDYCNMPYIYSQHDVLILASKEMASVAVVEAMSNGLCVLGSIYNGTSSYLEEYNCGKTFDPFQKDALVLLLDELSNNPSDVERFGRIAKQVVNRYLSFDEYRGKLYKLLEEKY